jgi:hypothetical protein
MQQDILPNTWQAGICICSTAIREITHARNPPLCLPTAQLAAGCPHSVWSITLHPKRHILWGQLLGCCKPQQQAAREGCTDGPRQHYLTSERDSKPIGWHQDGTNSTQAAPHATHTGHRRRRQHCCVTHTEEDMIPHHEPNTRRGGVEVGQLLLLLGCWGVAGVDP